MTYEEAKRILHPDTTWDDIRELTFDCVDVVKAVEQACIVACEAIDKQIPKKPKNIIQRTENTFTGNCPCCGAKQSYGTAYWHRWFNKFCYDCGQALDWSDVT